jgi:hypothetical protein
MSSQIIPQVSLGSNYTWTTGGVAEADVSEGTFYAAGRCRTVRFRDITQTGNPVKWTRQFCMCKDGLAIGEPIAYQDRVAQCVIKIEILAREGRGEEDNQGNPADVFQTNNYKLFLVVMDAEDGKILHTFDIEPVPATVAGNFNDASIGSSSFGAASFGSNGGISNSFTFPKFTELESYNRQGTFNRQNGSYNDGLGFLGEARWYYSLRAEANYFGNIEFPDLKIIIPRFSQANQMYSVSLTGGNKLWSKEGFAGVPADLAARDVFGASIGEATWTRTFYTPICKWNDTSFLVHFSEIDHGITSRPLGPYGIYESQTDGEPRFSTWAGRWNSLGDNFALFLNPLSSDYLEALNKNGEVLSNLESELTQVLETALENIVGDWYEARHGYMVVNAATGAEEIKAFYNDPVIREFDPDRQSLLGGSGSFSKTTVSGTPPQAFGPERNLPGELPLAHAGDVEPFMPGPRRFSNPNPNTASEPPVFVWRDLVLPEDRPLEGQLGGTITVGAGLFGTIGPGEAGVAAVARDDIYIFAYEIVTGAPLDDPPDGHPTGRHPDYVKSLKSQADQIGGNPVPFIWVGVSPVNGTSVFRYYYVYGGTLKEQIWNRPTPWHTCKCAVHDDTLYVFPRDIPGNAYNADNDNTASNNVDFDLVFHNDRVAEAAKVRCLTLGASVIEVWVKSMHDGDVVGPPPDTIPASFNNPIAGVLDTRHGNVIGNPLVTDDHIYILVQDLRSASSQANPPFGTFVSGIKHWIVKLDKDSGSVVQKKEIDINLTDGDPTTNPSAIAETRLMRFDTMILAGCEIHGQSGPDTWIIPQDVSLVFKVQPTSAIINTAIAPAIEVSLLDSIGEPIITPPAIITLSIDNNPGSATLGGTLAKETIAGVATFDNITLDAAGNGYTLKAEALTASEISASFNITLI